MPRGRKKRVLQCHPPPKGYYTVDWVINDLVSLNALSGPALGLWLHLKGLAWERGECDPTDERLAELMGGVTAEMVRITRRELRGKHLLLEYQKPASAVRWLIPLPVLSGLRGSLAAEIAAQVAGAEAQLRQLLAQRRTPQAERRAGSNGNSPQVQFGANSICSKLALKEEEGKYAGEIYLPAPPERVNAIARGNGEGGAGGGRFHPKPDLGQIRFGANSAGGEIAAAAANPERAELTAFLVAHGAFPSVTGDLVMWLLAHKTVADAKVYALAHLRAAQRGETPRGEPLQGEQAIGRWVARLRQHARAPEWALAQAARELEAAAGADEEPLGEDGPAVDDVVGDRLPDKGPDDAGNDGAAAVAERVCIPLSGQPATPSAVWEASKAQLRLQMARGAFDTWVADTCCIGVEEDPEAADSGRILVVQVANKYAAEWLELRLKRLILRTLHGLVGGEIGVRFRVAGESSASRANEQAIHQLEEENRWQQ